MNIDTNTLVILSLSATAVLFAYGFIRSLLRERKVEMANRINELEDGYWREHEKIWARINHIERCCREQSGCTAEKYPTKNHYNTGA
jgi:hypothetical protein